MTLLPDPKVIREYVTIWSEFLDTLASEGGHIILWATGVVFGVVVVWIGFDILGDRIIAGAITGLGIALKTANSNAKRKQEMGTTTVLTETGTSTVPPVVNANAQ